MSSLEGREAASPTAARAHRPRVLIAEDEPDVLEILQVIFESEGFAVESASSGLQALRAQARRPADLVVLDLMLPELSGLAVLRGLRRLCRGRSLPPVIVCSGFPQLAARALEHGARFTVSKPFDVDGLLEIAWRALGGRR